MEAAMSRCGSLVEMRAITAKVICPGCSNCSPCLREMILQRGGRMRDTVTRLPFPIPASRSASSKLRNSCLCVPTPLVKKIFDGTKCMWFFLASAAKRNKFLAAMQEIHHGFTVFFHMASRNNIVTIGLIQMRCTAQPKANLKMGLALVDKAAKRGSHIVCLPELF